METVKFDTIKWKRFGLSLGLHSNTLNALQGDHAQCLMGTLEAWLRKQDDVKKEGGTTLNNLVKAVRATGNNAAADEIIKTYGGL